MKIQYKILLILLVIPVALFFFTSHSYATYDLTNFYLDYNDSVVTFPEPISLADDKNHFVFLTYSFTTAGYLVTLTTCSTDINSRFILKRNSNAADSYQPYDLYAYDSNNNSTNIEYHTYSYNMDLNSNSLSLTAHKQNDLTSVSFIYNYANGDPETFYLSTSSKGNKATVLLYASQNEFLNENGELVFQGGPLTPVGLITTRHLNQAVTKMEIAQVLKTIVPIAIAVFSAFLVVFLIRYLILRVM